MTTVLSIISALCVIALALNELRGIKAVKASRLETADWARRRRRDLAVRPEDLSPDARGLDPHVVLMELGFPANTLTLAAFADGRASLYSSAGGAPLESGDKESARAAAAALVAQAADSLAAMRPVAAVSKPSAGNVRFNLVGLAGVSAAEEDEEALDKGWSPLAGLYAAGMRTIRALQEGAAPEPAEGEPSP